MKTLLWLKQQLESQYTEEFGNVGGYRCRCGDPENYQNALIYFILIFKAANPGRRMLYRI